MREWILLVIAIVGELLGTTCLKLTNGLERPIAWLGVVGGYGTAFWLLALVIQKIDIGVTYALWSGLGIVMAVAVGVAWFGESLTWIRVLGILAIAFGIALIELDPGRKSESIAVEDARSTRPRSP